MNDLRIEVRFKNAVLYRVLHETFEVEALARHTVGQFSVLKVASERLGVSGTILRGFLNLTRSPFSEIAGKMGEPTESALKVAQALGMSPAELFPAHLYSGKFKSAMVVERDTSAMLSLHEARAIPSPDSLMADMQRMEATQALYAALKKLSPREEKILRAKFGLTADGDEVTNADLSHTFCVTPQRIYEIEAKAMRKLRGYFEWNKPALDAVCDLVPTGFRSF